VPGIEHRKGNRSPIAYGGALLKVEEGRRLRLTGEYWTERNSTGALAFESRNPRRAASFADAEEMDFDPTA
jgi:hypothetical protein